MNYTKLTFTVFSSVIVGILVLAIWASTYVYAQQSPSSSSSSTPSTSSASASMPSVPKVKITSPTKGQQVPVGKDLTISGTSIDNATSNCHVSVIVNKVRPYQNTSAAGPSGPNDYSKWNYVLTSKYTTIKPGANNRITAKYECANNPALTAFYSVNVTGVVQQQQQEQGTTGGGTASGTTTTKAGTGTAATATANSATPAATAAAKTLISSLPTALHTTSSAAAQPRNNKFLSSPSAIAPQVNAISQQQQEQQPSIAGINIARINMTGINATIAGQNYTFAAVSLPGVASGKLMYLGYHGSDSSSTGTSSSKGSNSDTKPSVHHTRSSITIDNGSNEKTSNSKSDSSHSNSDNTGSKDNGSSKTKSSSHTNGGSKSPSSDLASSIKNKVNSVIRNSIHGF